MPESNWGNKDQTENQAKSVGIQKKKSVPISFSLPTANKSRKKKKGAIYIKKCVLISDTRNIVIEEGENREGERDGHVHPRHREGRSIALAAMRQKKIRKTLKHQP